MIARAAEVFFLLCCAWAALSWVVPTYLLKPPADDPDGDPRLTMPHVPRPHLRSGGKQDGEHGPRRLRSRRFKRR